MYSYDELMAAERQLWDAYPTGRRVDLRPEGADADVEHGADWGADRTIRADVVTTLLLGGHPARPGAAPALRLAGARITGRLDLGGVEIPHELRFEQCWWEEPVDLNGTVTRTVVFEGSRVPGLDLSRARVEGTLFLRSAVVQGRLSLINARVAGELLLSGATVSNPGDWAVFGGGLVVEGGFFCRGTTFHGGIRLLGAQLAGGLHMERARLHHRRADALLANHVSVRTLNLADGFTVEGAVRLQDARIADQLTFDGSFLAAEGTAVDFARMQAGALVFTPAEPPSSPVDLQHAHVASLEDRASCWPGTVRLRGFTYGSLHDRDVDGVDSAAARLAWLDRDPGYASQPYEQLASWYRQLGHDDDARRVLLARQRRRRRTLGPAARLWGHLLDATVGYGYRPWLAGLWLAALTLVGTAVFATHTPHPTDPGKVPPFQPFVYTLDLLIPIGGLGQRDSWYWPPGTLAWLSYAFIATGWILTTAVLSGVTRTLNRN
ncbi:oxidoreductase [Streptomyces sp. 7R007]